MELSSQKQPDIYKELLWSQKEPFELLWSSRIRLSENRYLVSLWAHTLRLLRILADLAHHGQSDRWEAVYIHLHLAASIESIGVNSDIHRDGLLCRPPADHDDAMSRVKLHFLAGTLVFQCAWNAYENARKVISKQEISANTQAIGDKLNQGRYRPMYGFEETVVDAHRTGNRYMEINNHTYRESIATGSYLCVAGEQLRQFRNGILHGEIRAMNPLDWSPDSNDQTHEDQTELFHTHIRLVLFLLQDIVARIESKHVMAWPNEGDRVEELIFGLQKELPGHLEDELDDDENLMRFLREQKYVNQI